ncbi:MAG: hypothetical protein ACRYGP_29935 [Janthinobacterium lividum]
MKGTELAMRNPLEWFEQVALPAMKAHGVDTETASKLSTELALFVRKGTANDFAESLAQESSRHQIHSDIDNIKAAGSLDDQYHPSGDRPTTPNGRTSSWSPSRVARMACAMASNVSMVALCKFDLRYSSKQDMTRSFR